MYFKLSIRNATRSMKSYGIYFLTLVFGVCVFYMFNSLDAQEEIMALTQREEAIMKILAQVLNVISVFVSVVLGFLIVYANGFLIKRRKKELGVYLTLGMEKHQISIILVLETVVLAIIALVVGLVIGVFGSQIMSVFTAKMFEVDMTSFKFIFSPSAVGKSIFFFSIIFVVVILFNTFTISKCKLIDLLYGDKKNQELKIKSVKFSVILFFVSIVSLIISYYLIITNGFRDLTPDFYGSLIFGTIGTFLFFLSTSGFIVQLLKRFHKIYFKNLNMFVIRQINNSINTNVVSMTIVCIVLLLTIGTLATGASVSKVMSQDLTEKTPYDISFFANADQTENIQKDLEEKKHIDDYITVSDEISFYIVKGLFNKDLLTNQNNDKSSYFLRNPIKFISLSDYNENAKIQGKDILSIKDNEYAIINVWDKLSIQYENIVKENTSFTINGTNLYPSKAVKNVRLYTEQGDFQAPVIVIRDKYISNMEKDDSVFNVNFKNDNAREKFLEDYSFEDNFYYMAKADIYSDAIGVKTVSAFLAIYLGFVFLVTSAAILSIQQLSQSSDNKERFALLRKLGADDKILKHTLFIQIFVYFMLPLSLAIVHSIVGLKVVNDLIVQMGQIDVLSNIILTGLFIIGIYGLYFIATYIGSKNIINNN